MFRRRTQRSAADGDDEFLAALETHRDEFYRFIYRNVWDTGAAEDVFSQGVLAAYENRSRFTPGTNFRAWMYRILTNKCYVANRETRRGPEPAEVDVRAAEPDGPIHFADPEAALEQCGDEVFRAMRALSTAQRTCLLLRGVERFSYQEIAEIMEIPVGTVMTHLARGRKRLRLELNGYAAQRGIVKPFPRVRPAEERGGAQPDEEHGRSSIS